MTETYPMRRRDRAITTEDALRVIKAAHFAVLATVGSDGRPYAVPVNAAYCDGVLYFHGTEQKSRKADNIAANPAVALTFVAYEKRLAEERTVDYASAIVEGEAHLVTDETERQKAFLAICEAHAAGPSPEKHLAYTRREGDSAALWRVTIRSLSGKSRSWSRISDELG